MKPRGGRHGDGDELSNAQFRLWRLWQLAPTSPACNLFCALRLSGRLNVNALHRAFDSLSARHETLMTVIQHQPNGPRLALSTRRSRVEHTDVRALPRSQRDKCVEALVMHHALQPFDLELQPPWRSSLLKLEDDERILVLCMHRLISDERFLQVLIGELIHNYRCYDGGRAPAQPIYNTAVFDAAAIEGFAAHVQGLLKAIVTDPTQRIGTLQSSESHGRDAALRFADVSPGLRQLHESLM